MPIISMFYGIIIRLYLIDNQHHNLPHLHAKYAEFEASVGIADGEILSGELPRKQLRLVQAWIELHPRRVDGRLGVGCQRRKPLQDRSPVRLPCTGM